MSIWMNVQAVFEIQGVAGARTQKELVDCCKQKFLPLPCGSEKPLDIRVILWRLNYDHFADVIISGSIRNVKTYKGLYAWMKDVQTKANSDYDEFGEPGKNAFCYVGGGTLSAKVYNKKPVLALFRNGFWEVMKSRFMPNPLISWDGY